MGIEVTDRGNQLATRVRAEFLIPPPEEEILPERLLDPLSELGSIEDAFRASVVGLITTACIPFIFAQRSVLSRRRLGFELAERIRARRIEAEEDESQPELDERRHQSARASASEKFDEWRTSSSGIEVAADDILAELLGTLADEKMFEAARELMRQAVVLAWGAYEVSYRDMFICLLNAKPNLVTELLSIPTARRRFDVSRLPIDLLVSHQFDLSGKMGEILAQQQDFSDIFSIRAVSDALFPSDADLRERLLSENLRQLSLQRHLIVHRCGVIDQQYAKQAGGFALPGEKLAVEPSAFEAQVKALVAAAYGAFKAARSRLSE